MKRLVLIAFLFITISIYGNNDSIANLQQQVNKQERIIGNLRKDIRSSVGIQKQQALFIDSLKQELMNTKNDLSDLSNKLGVDITNTQKQITVNTNNLNDNIKSKTTLGILIATIIILVMAAIYLFLYKRVEKGKSAIDKIKNTQKELQKAQEELVKESSKLDEKLVDLLDKQLNVQTISLSALNSKKDIDHSLALKIANELVKIETVLSKMDSTIKGHSHLLKAVEHVKNNLKANGYEIINLIGQDYNEGMPFNARFIPDETLPEGKRIISGINKYQINYNDKMIQAADIVVRQNI